MQNKIVVRKTLNLKRYLYLLISFLKITKAYFIIKSKIYKKYYDYLTFIKNLQ